MKNRGCVFAILSVLLVSCGTFSKLGDNLGSGFNKNTQSMGRNLMAGVQEGMSDSAFKANLTGLVDSIVNTMGVRLTKNIAVIVDTLLSPKWFAFTRQLVENITGVQTRANVAALTEELLGAQTNARINRLIRDALNEVFNNRTTARLASLRNELLGAATSDQLAAIRNELLGVKTNEAIKAIVDSSMMRIAFRLNHDVKDAVGQNTSFIRKYAGRLLIILGAIAAVIIFLVWRNRQKYLKLVTVLTSQINSIPDQRVYDDLTSLIKERAVEHGVEPSLRKMLHENGLMGKESWEINELKKRRLLAHEN